MSPLSALLVGLQFGLLALLAWPVGPIRLDAWAGLGWLLVALAIALGIWAIVAMRLDTFSVMPEPAPRGRLCTRGPYGSIRHPMYSAVLLAGLGANLVHGTRWQWIGLLALAIVLVLKIRREENLLRQRFADYDAYGRRTGALLPNLFGPRGPSS
ncbi:MAG: isoprenylcysteine carboxylmethyltransferase family protein [Burkholderiaceae bacterium]